MLLKIGASIGRNCNGNYVKSYREKLSTVSTGHLLFYITPFLQFFIFVCKIILKDLDMCFSQSTEPKEISFEMFVFAKDCFIHQIELLTFAVRRTHH